MMPDAAFPDSRLGLDAGTDKDSQMTHSARKRWCRPQLLVCRLNHGALTCLQCCGASGVIQCSFFFFFFFLMYLFLFF